MLNDQLFKNLINPGRVGEAVSLMLGNPSVQIKEWHCEPIHGGVEALNVVFRCQGTAESGDKLIPWSIIAKTTSKGLESEHPQGYRYWKRETLAYQSDLVKNLAEHLSAPQVYAIDENSENTVVIWMEDVKDDFFGNWSLDGCESAAYQLGVFNGSYLSHKSLPDEDWITRDWLEKYVDHASPMVDFISNNPGYPLVKSLYGKSVPFILALWQIRTDLFRCLAKMPQVFCHQDTIKRNLFINQGRLTAIDWGYAGIAPLGTDLVPLIAYLPGLNEFPQDQVHEMDLVCFNAYLRGVKTINPNISGRFLRRSVLFTLLLRYLFGGNIGELFPALLDKETRDLTAKAFDKTVEDLSKKDAVSDQYYQAKVFEALKLMNIKTLTKFSYYYLTFSFWYKRQTKPKT